MNEIVKYQNGNTAVVIFSDGTKIRECNEDTPHIVHPESIDVKITNYCDLGCPYCHENSTINGDHADLFALLQILKELPSGVELAIGGGNPLSHPLLEEFLMALKSRGLIANITVNQSHIQAHKEKLVKLTCLGLIYGLGVSVKNSKGGELDEIKAMSDNVVFHLIAGINNISDIDDLLRFNDTKVLVLGYKTFGRGVGYYNEDVEKRLSEWKRGLRSYIGRCTMSFDNLAIEQLNVRKLFTIEGWQRFYMGDDFSFTMYIDAVKQQYAPTSRSINRKSFSDYPLLEYFRTERQA